MICNILRRSFSSAIQPGSILTWGIDGMALGRVAGQDSGPSPIVRSPPDPVIQVIQGYQSKGLLTERGELYVLGNNSYGQLGKCNSQQNEPFMINFFTDIKKKVLDVAIGKYHSSAVTEDGLVYTWGSAGFMSFFISRFTTRSFSTLGRNQEYASEPTVVDLPACKSVAAGNDFSVALTQKGLLYGWGNLRAGKQDPGIVRQVMKVADKEHSPIVKVKAVDQYMMIQLQNGKLYSYGSNMFGAMACRYNHLLRTDVMLPEVHKVIQENFHGAQVIDYEIGQNSSIFLLDNGKVFFSGLDMKFNPTEMPLPQGVKVNSIAASDDSLGVATEQGVYMIGEFMAGGRYRNQMPMFRNKEVFKKIGGRYQDRWASR